MVQDRFTRMTAPNVAAVHAEGSPVLVFVKCHVAGINRKKKDRQTKRYVIGWMCPELQL